MGSEPRGQVPDTARDREGRPPEPGRPDRGTTWRAARSRRPPSGATAWPSTPSPSGRACCATCRRSTPRRPSSGAPCASRSCWPRWGPSRPSPPGGGATAAKASAEFGVPQMLSSVCNPGLEAVAAAADNFRIFQLYVRGDDAWIDDHVKRARDHGYAAFCLTVDTASYSRRERDLARRFVKPWRVRATGHNFQAALSWDHVKRFKDTHDIPLILKGIATAEDALHRVRARRGVHLRLQSRRAPARPRSRVARRPARGGGGGGRAGDHHRRRRLHARHRRDQGHRPGRPRRGRRPSGVLRPGRRRGARSGARAGAPGGGDPHRPRAPRGDAPRGTRPLVPPPPRRR